MPFDSCNSDSTHASAHQRAKSSNSEIELRFDKIQSAPGVLKTHCPFCRSESTSTELSVKVDSVLELHDLSNLWQS